MNPKSNFFELPIPTRDGEFTARYSENGLAELNFPNGRAELPLGQAAQQHRPTKWNAVPAKIRKWHRTTETALKNILAGHQPKKLPPLDLAGTGRCRRRNRHGR